MAKKMFVEGGKEGEWKPSIIRGALRPLSEMQFNRWAKTRAKVELQADPEVVARREEVLAALREKYDAEDKLNPGPLTPAETVARAREWVNARAANNPLPYPEPAGIDFCFDTPTRGGADASDRLYKVGKGNIVEKLLSERAFRDTSEGVELISESRVSINAAMQIAHQRFGGKPIAFQGGWDQSRDVIAAKSIILGIPVKGPDMERRVSQLRAKIDKEKEAILAKEGHQPVRQTPEPERQREPEVELTPEQTPEIQPVRETPEMQQTVESEILAKQAVDDVLKGLTVESATIVCQFEDNEDGREVDGWLPEPQAVVEITLRDQESREVHLVYNTMLGDFQTTNETSEELDRELQSVFEASDDARAYLTAANMVGFKLDLDDIAREQLAVAIHEAHVAAIATQLQGGTPTPDPEIPGHVGRNAQGDNVCALNDETGNVRAWGVYGDDGTPHVSQGKEGWKKALDGMVSEAMKARESTRASKESPEMESPAPEKSTDDRDL